MLFRLACESFRLHRFISLALEDGPGKSSLEELYLAFVYDFLSYNFRWLSIGRPPHFNRENA